MAEFSLTEEARRDLEAIYLYSLENFGEAQADRYLRGLFQQFQLLADFPGVGRPAGLAGFEFRRFGYGPHVILFSTGAGDTIRIEFIIDGRMDIPSALSRRLS